MSDKRKSNWWIFWLIVFIGVLPWIGAWYLVNHPGPWGEAGNHGNLIQPARPQGYDLFHPLPGARKPLREIRGRWVMIHLIVPDDAAGCRELLENTRRLHPLFSKDIPRVRRLAVWREDRPPDTKLLNAMLNDRDLYVATVSASFMRQLESSVIRQAPHCGQLLLMDPLANLMMWYDAGFDPFGLYRDLKRLLRASRIG
ncbi:MAG TPA: hypothetical protein ENI90_03030 [Methylothermaceae bacterium]|nr:hypothetical protein [Methylothermaceae bacterium]